MAGLPACFDLLKRDGFSAGLLKCTAGEKESPVVSCLWILIRKWD